MLCACYSKLEQSLIQSSTDQICVRGSLTPMPYVGEVTEIFWKSKKISLLSSYTRLLSITVHNFLIQNKF